MNFIKEINGFERWLESNYLPTNSQLVWYKLFMLSNRAGWPQWIQVDNYRLMVLSCISNKNTFLLAREKLLECGLIVFEKGKKGYPNRYKLTSLEGFGQGYVLKPELKVGLKNGDIYKDKQNQNKQIKKNEKPISAIADLLKEYSGDDEELLVLLNDFAQARKESKKPLTQGAVRVLIKTLSQAQTRDDKLRALEKSILNGYQGVFLPECKNQPIKGSQWDILQKGQKKKSPLSDCKICAGVGFYEIKREDNTSAMAYCSCWYSEDC